MSMEPFWLEIRPLREGPGSLAVEGDWVGLLEIAGDDWRVSGPARVRGELALEGEDVLLRGELAATLETVCARCLSTFETKFRVEIEETWPAPPPGTDRIDVGGLLREVFLAGLPARFLCREDCRGLCPTCGQDLNRGVCHCEAVGVDPRLASLADLLPKRP